jgi:DNA replication protein DnaC
MEAIDVQVAAVLERLAVQKQITSSLSGVNVCTCDFGIAKYTQPVTYCTCPRGQELQRRDEAQRAAARQKKLDRMFADSGIPKKFQGLTIDSLIQVAGKEQGKRNALKAAQELYQYGETQGKKGLLIFGDFGVGKTGLLTPILVKYLSEGKSGLWIEFYDFTDTVQSSYARGSDTAADDLIRAAVEADIILLDDVGNPKAGQETPDRSKILYRVINGRHNAELPMLISSNLAPDEFAQQLGSRTYDRIADSCRVVKMEGKNLRHE